MDTQPDKNKQKEARQRIQALENELKIAFKSGKLEAVATSIKGIRTLDPQNRLAELIEKKAGAAKKQAELKTRESKVRDYKVMLKKLLKDHNAAKLKELAIEFVKFDPENKVAKEWLRKAEKLEAKLAPKKKEEKKAVAEIKKPVGPTKEKKPSFLSGLFKKKETKPAITTGILTKQPEVKPVAPKEALQPVVEVKKSVPIVPTAVVAKKEEKPALVTGLLKKPETDLSKTAPAGNIFTKMFGKKEEEEVTKNKSIIDTIVASDIQKDKKFAPEKGIGPLKSEKPKDASSLLTFSKVFMNFAILFIALSAAFLYVEWVDKSNTMLSLVGVSENTGAKLYSAAEEASTLTQKEADLNKEIELYKGGYDDKTFKTVQDIIVARINWPDIFAKIAEVTNSVYELNDFFKYIEYNNYSFDAENGTIRVTGTLSDPLGRNLTKLVELEEAFENFPRDKNNPDDKTKPYFAGFKEFTTFSKSLDEATGRYNSSFQLAFSLNK